jgi:hypothetical protein
MKSSVFVVLVAVILAWGAPLPSYAQTVPAAITYQGRLTDASGSNLPDGTGYEIEARLWQSQTATATPPVWASRYSGVPVKNGAFTLILASGGTAIGSLPTDVKAALANTTVYLGLTVTKSATGAVVSGATEILPRQQLLASPFAVRADVATSATANAIGTVMLQDGAVTRSKLGVDAVGAVNIAANVISSTHIAGNSIDPDRLNPVLAVISDRVASGTAPQAAKLGWQKRQLNGVEVNLGTGITFDDASDQFTLAAGVYEITAQVPYYGHWVASGKGSRHRAAIRKTSDQSLLSVTGAYGTEVEGANVYTNGFAGGVMTLSGIIVVSGASESFELVHHIQDTNNKAPIGTDGNTPVYGFCGIASSAPGVQEVYSRLTIKKIR